MTRIGMILDAPFPPDYRVEKEASTLVQAGHDVFLFCLQYEGAYSEDVFKQIHVHHYQASKLEYKLSALAYTLPFYHMLMKPKIEDFVTRVKPEVLHVHDMVIAEAAFNVARRNRLKVVLDLHENRPAIMKEYRHLKKFPGKYLINLNTWRKKQADLVNRADKVIVVTDLAKQDLLLSTTRRDEDIIVVPNTPSEKFATHPLDDGILRKMANTFNLLYIGDTSERRGTVDMVEVVQSLRNDIPEIALWMIGTSSFDPELRRLVNRMGLAEHVHFEGWQPEVLYPSYITGAHICLSPLKRNPHHDTTFANKIFQYMSLGRPAVVSDCPAQAKLIQDENSGLVYSSSIPDDFRQKILHLYRDEQRRTKLGINARNAVAERWSWEKTSKYLTNLYRVV